ncbi:response regulator [Roseicella sp. GB24]|uniref:Response regulator n=1 Tax=Roseicella aerolata TaxID=2883479 RepID=A0A9X1IAJ4_9PROT|nr:response regulator [Roseicella aerolata]MCB4820244.1 response regulator [Roseicella aerolata]
MPAASGATRSVILIVEDEAMLALELEQVLSEGGHEAVLAADGAGALARAADPGLRLRAAVVDLHLPGSMPGREVIRCLRMQYPGLPVVVVTGYSPMAPQADLRGLGGPTARLQKPIQPARLLQRLGDAMTSTNGIA